MRELWLHIWWRLRGAPCYCGTPEEQFQRCVDLYVQHCFERGPVKDSHRRAVDAAILAERQRAAGKVESMTEDSPNTRGLGRCIAAAIREDPTDAD